MKNLKYFKELDGIRAIAAFMVMFLHFFQYLNLKGGIYTILNKVAIFGGTGVSLFFVLSGFLITRILLANKEKSKYFSNFFIRRSLRIFPLYYFFLFFFYFIFPSLSNTTSTLFGEQFFYWIYLQNFAITFNWLTIGPPHFWSLAVEEHFYLFWPFVIYFTNKERLKYIIGFILFFSFILRYYLLENSIDVFFFTFTRFDELALGGGLALIEVNGGLKKSKSIYFKLLLVPVFTCAIILWLLFSGQQNQWIQVFKYNSFSFFYFSILGIILTSETTINALLSYKIFSYLGKISYGLYVWHPVCFILYNRFCHFGLLIDFILSFLFTVLIASISYYFIEIHFLKIKEKYFSSRLV